jgi:hypothetical protein
MRTHKEILDAVRFKIGGELNAVKAMLDSGDPSFADKEREIVAKVHRCTGFLAGYLYSLKSSLPAAEFAQLLDSVKMGDDVEGEEMQSMLKLAQELASPHPGQVDQN